jgi:ribonuclease D
MYALLRLISERLGVAIPLLATRDDLYEFAAGDKDCNLRKGWRYEVVGKTLDGLLQGAVGLTVKDGHIEML